VIALAISGHAFVERSDAVWLADPSTPKRRTTTVPVAGRDGELAVVCVFGSAPGVLELWPEAVAPAGRGTIRPTIGNKRALANRMGIEKFIFVRLKQLICLNRLLSELHSF
jgi:hypothetical protein